MFIPFSINWEFVYSFLLGVFSFFGLCPISTRNAGKPNADSINFVLLLWSAFHFVFSMAIAVMTAQIFIYHSSDATDATIGVASFNNVLKFFSLTLTHVVTVVESVYVRQNFVEIWKRVNSIDEMLENIIQDYNKTRKEFLKATSRKIIVCLLLMTAIELTIIIKIHAIKDWSLIWWVLITPLTFSRLRHLQHTFYIDLLASRFRTMKKELSQIVKLTKLDHSKIIPRNLHFYDGMFRRINTIKNVYNITWEMSLFINRSFGLSQLVNLLQNFIQLTCDLYLVYSFLYNNSLEYIIGTFYDFYCINIVITKLLFILHTELVASLLPTVLILILVLNACEDCLEQVRYIGFLLHNIEKDVNDPRINTLAENFSLQILHEPLLFSVSGFFQMDFMFAKSIIAGITTYMVIFIQFMPKENAAPNVTVAETTTQLAVTKI